jgi:hypothetical protein
MRKLVLASLLALPLAVAGGLIYSHALNQDESVSRSEKPGQVKTDGYTCPLTGEELPCPNCCPLNQK